MFKKSPFSNLKPSRLRKLMWLFFIAMALPTAVLVYKSYDQLKWEAFYQHRLLAEELSVRIDQKFREFVEREESRSFGDYSFVVVEGSDAANYIERSPLSDYPVSGQLPGLVGYFQIDASGTFSTPLLPKSSSLAARYGLATPELEQRRNAEALVEEILSSNQLVEKRDSQSVTTGADQAPDSLGAASPESRAQIAQSADDSNFAVQNQAAFDKLSEVKQSKFEKSSPAIEEESVLGRLEKLELDSPYKEKVGKRQIAEEQKKSIKAALSKKEQARSRKISNKKVSVERELVENEESAESGVADITSFNDSDSSRIKIFESEIDPFEISLLESGHFVLYRKVWRDDQRYIQGLLVDQTPLINSLISESFDSSLLADMSTLTTIYQGNALASFDRSGRSYSSRRGGQLNGTLLYRTRLSEPFSQLENVFTIRSLPAGPGGQVILWAAFIMAAVLSVGIFLLYRMSLRNLELVNQQQDFVSAVSHELKTPLTSIRMYGEILQEGWASEDKKKGYYSYIFDESERLTRLINNVLELARMTRNETRVDMKTISVTELADIIHSKVDSQIERSDFKLSLSIEESASSAKLKIDPDVFAQIVINLVDNALKFSSKSEKRVIDISAVTQSNGKLCFAVRDYGPGIAKDQLKKIFELFYRSENELTRETTGTGIGLALVSQLTQLMNGEIDVVNREPGAEFKLYFQSVS